MMEINAENAVIILKNNILANAMEIDNLNWASNKGKYYLFNGAIVAVISDDKTYIHIIPTETYCDYTEIGEFINQYPDVCLTVNIYGKNEKIARDVFEKSFNTVKEIVDYGADELNTCKKNDNVRLLSKCDREAFISMENESLQYRPPLNVLFTVFVEKGSGEILAYFDEDKIIGYLSYNNLFDNVYDVDYIYVAPSQRRKGIGKALASSYVSTVQERKGIAYWSNAKNENSEKTAISAGLNIVRKALIFN